MKRSETFEHAVERRLKVVQLLRKKEDATNKELQEVYGDKLMSTQHMGLLKRAVKARIAHPERYSPMGLKSHLDGPMKTPAAVRKLHAVPSAVDKQAGLKRYLDEVVLPGMLPYTVGSDVQTVIITVTTDPAGNPTLSRKIGKSVMEWDEHTLDPRGEADNG